MFSSCYTPIPTHRHVTAPQDKAPQREAPTVASSKETSRAKFTPIHSNETIVSSTPSAPPPTPARSNFPINDVLSISATDLTHSLVDIEHSQAKSHTRTTSITSNSSYDEGYQAEVESVTPRSRSISFSGDIGDLYDSDSSQQTVLLRCCSISIPSANSQVEHIAPRSGNMSITSTASLDSTQADPEYMSSRSRSVSISSATSYELDSSPGEDHIDTWSHSASIASAASEEESSNLVVSYLQKAYPKLTRDQLSELEQLVERSTNDPENGSHTLAYLGKLAIFAALNEEGRNANTGGI